MAHQHPVDQLLGNRLARHRGHGEVAVARGVAMVRLALDRGPDPVGCGIGEIEEERLRRLLGAFADIGLV